MAKSQGERIATLEQIVVSLPCDRNYDELKKSIGTIKTCILDIKKDVSGLKSMGETVDNIDEILNEDGLIEQIKENTKFRLKKQQFKDLRSRIVRGGIYIWLTSLIAGLLAAFFNADKIIKFIEAFNKLAQ